ncbi:hypothetical protein F511_43271 [Dorcoceras hygrometricum]|uniref:Uncharacterized protein n=1 Tax=Dorcoceras hygrometricum TaxID=472368 RepID=A0A2Z7CYY6_9LAMI|nr:hypothetical protein F511_43271 [Dorcoceras hygrometricum]
MGTEVLLPQDLLADRFRVPPGSIQRRRNFYGNANLTNLVVNRKQNNSTGYKKTSPKPEKKRSNPATEVTLLKRGESLDSLTSKMKGGNFKVCYPDPKPVDDLAVCGTSRIGPDSPGMVPKLIRLHPSTDGYAGSAFSLSPSPRSLPLPSFFKKHVEDGEAKVFDDSATRDLRRLLRLD